MSLPDFKNISHILSPKLSCRAFWELWFKKLEKSIKTAYTSSERVQEVEVCPWPIDRAVSSAIMRLRSSDTFTKKKIARM